MKEKGLFYNRPKEQWQSIIIAERLRSEIYLNNKAHLQFSISVHINNYYENTPVYKFHCFTMHVSLTVC
jgi:hypothetical protein